MRFLRPLLLAPVVVLAALAVPASALGSVAVSGFSVTPSTTQAGAHPNVVISTAFSLSATDDVRDVTVRLPPGLVGNPRVVAKCTAGQLAGDACPAATTVGTVSVQATIGGLLPSTSPGTVYNLAPVGSEPARLGIVVRPTGAPPIILVGVAKLGPETGYALETTIANQPRDAGGLPIQVQRIDLTLRGQTAGGPFTTNPSSCAAATASVTAVSYEAPGSPARASAPFAATGCGALPFAPVVSGTVGAKGANRKGAFIPLTTAFSFPAGSSTLRDSVVTLPRDVSLNFSGVGVACGIAVPVASCPARSRIGSARADSPLLDAPLQGPVILKAASGKLPKLVVSLTGAAPLTLEGTSDIVGGRQLRTRFPGAPDVPLSRFALTINGGKNGLLQATEDLCRAKPNTKARVALTGWSGRATNSLVALAPQGCKGYRPPKPKAAATLKRGVLTFRVTAGRYTRVRSITTRLPAGVSVPRRRLKVKVASSGATAARALGFSIRTRVSGRGANRVRLTARGVRVERRLRGKRLTARLAIKDDTGRTVRTRVRFRVPR